MKGLKRSLDRRADADKDVVLLDIDLTGVTVDVTSVAAAIGFGSVVIGDFAEGNVLYHGLAGTVGFAGSGSDADLSDTWSGDFGIGTTPASDATITAGDVDLLASKAIGAATAEVIAAARFASDQAKNGVIFDNTDGSLEINLNLLIDAADIVDDKTVTITLSGKLTVAYTILSDD